MWTFHAMGTEVTFAAPLLADDQERRVASDIAALFGETERAWAIAICLVPLLGAAMLVVSRVRTAMNR